jgi:hypothetical protein
MSEGLCTEKVEEECKLEFGSKYTWACKDCKKKKPEEISPYTLKLLQIRLLMKGGYPFAANDLSKEDWMDLGVVEQWLHTQESNKMFARLAGTREK